VNVDIVGDGPDAVHTERDLLGHHLLRVGAGIAAQSDDTLFHGYADVAGFQAGIPVTCTPYTLFKALVSHGLPPVI
jgi:hypothetical protein